MGTRNGKKGKKKKDGIEKYKKKGPCLKQKEKKKTGDGQALASARVFLKRRGTKIKKTGTE